MRISDWSSDVCSSDLGIATVFPPFFVVLPEGPGRLLRKRPDFRTADAGRPRQRRHATAGAAVADEAFPDAGDRKSDVEGKSVPVRVDLGGSRIIEHKHNDGEKTNNRKQTTAYK